MANINYRSAGVWGSGLGRPLTSAEVDNNFFQLNQINHNVIPNGSGELGTKFWAGSIGFTSSTGVIGPFFDGGSVGTAATNFFYTDKFPVQAGISNSYSLDFQVVGFQGTDLYCDINYYDAGGSLISDGPNYAIPTADTSVFKSFSFTDSVPANAVFAILRIVATNAKWTTLRWTKTACAPFSPFPTAYNAAGNWNKVFIQDFKWTNRQEFNGSINNAISGGSNSVSIGGDGPNPSNPAVLWKKVDAPTDQKHWKAYSANGNFVLQLVNDGWNSTVDLLNAARSGMTITNLNFGVRPTFNGNAAWDAGNFNPANYLPLIGGTLTGWLTQAVGAGQDAMQFMRRNAGQMGLFRFQTGANPRWDIGVDNTAESGSNAGSSFVITRYNDAGVSQGSSLYIARDTGLATFGNGLQVNAGNLTVNATGAFDRFIILNRPNAQSGIFRITTAGVARWDWGGNNASETGSNVGTDWVLNRFSDAGSFIDTALSVKRSNGSTTFWRPPIIDGNTNNIDINLTFSAPAGKYRYNSYATGNSTRWTQGVDSSAESGSNAGSNWFLTRCNDSGVAVDNPVIVNRSTGVMTLSQRPVFGTRTPWDNGNLAPFIGTINGGVETDLNATAYEDRLAVNVTAGPNGILMINGTIRFEINPAGSAVDCYAQLAVYDTVTTSQTVGPGSLVSVGPWINGGTASGAGSLSPLMAVGALTPGRVYQIRLQTRKGSPIGPVYPRSMAMNWIGY